MDEMEKASVVKLGDASIASPFTSRYNSPISGMLCSLLLVILPLLTVCSCSSTSANNVCTAMIVQCTDRSLLCLVLSLHWVVHVCVVVLCGVHARTHAYLIFLCGHVWYYCSPSGVSLLTSAKADNFSLPGQLLTNSYPIN